MVSSRVKQLQDQARTLKVTNNVPFEKYIQLSQTLLKQVDNYQENDDNDRAYLFIYKFINLVMQSLPEHKDFKSAKYERSVSDLKKLIIKKYMNDLEFLQRKIESSNQTNPHLNQAPRPGTQQLARGNLEQLNWNQLLDTDKIAQRPPPQASNAPKLSQISTGQSFQQPVAANEYNKNDNFFDVSDLQSFDPENYRQQQQIQLQNQALQERQAGNSQKGAVVYGQNFLGLKNLPVLPAREYTPYVYQNDALNKELLSKHQILPPVNGAQDPYFSGNQASYEQYFPKQQVQYPQVPKFEEEKKKMQEKKKLEEKYSFVPPNVMLNDQEMEIQNVPTSAVQNNSDPCCDNQNIKEVQNQVVQASQNQSSRAEYVSKQGEFRYVYLSLGVLTEFLKFAKVNTHKGIEFCGVLCGTLSKDDSSFNLSAIIIPKQKGTANTVEMENEEELFDILETHSYFPLGWIHTHPTQTCFLSSIDVHTQLSWQLLIDEAMAIVMAPQDTKQKCGIFRLTTPGGLDLVKDCQERGFHTHPTPKTGQEIYELCGHVYLSEKIKHQVHDLR